jgi:hypothetical protein
LHGQSSPRNAAGGVEKTQNTKSELGEVIVPHGFCRRMTAAEGVKNNTTKTFWRSAPENERKKQ